MRVATGVWIVLVMLLAAPALAAESFVVNAEPINDVILPGQSAVFELSIINLENFDQRFSVSSLEYGYIVFLDPHPGTVEANSTETVSLGISPRSFINPGSRRVPVSVRSLTTEETEQVSVLVGIRDPERSSGVYVPSIALSVGVPDRVDPRNDLVVNVGLRNRNARQYTREDPLTVHIESDIVERSYDTQLGGVGDNGEKSAEVRLDLDAHQPPGEHPLTVTVMLGDRVVTTEQTSFTIMPVEDVQVTESSESVLFKSTTHYRIVNEGNTVTNATVSYPASSLSRPFIKASENYRFQSVDGESAVVVTTELAPEEEVVVSVSENYRLLAVLILLAILSGIGYYLLRSPVVVGKEASVSGAPEDGVSEVTVRVFLKNRSSNTLRNLRVVDRISGIAEIVKDNGLGTVRPTKIVKKKGQGTLLRWDIDQLEPFEERIITYRATSGLKLVGDLQLPAAKVKYDLPSGRERTSHSNEVGLKNA